MIVVDLGCADHGQWDSPVWLEERFHPEVIYGFDPSLTGETVRVITAARIIPVGMAAWVYDGEIQFVPDGTASTLVVHGEPLLDRTMWREPQPAVTVPCFDFAKWLNDLGHQVILKMDIEGAEFTLLNHVLNHGADKQIDLLLMEWHVATPEHRAQKEMIEKRLKCPTEDWAH